LNRPPIWLSLCSLLITAVVLVPDWPPLGVPSEWTWPRHAFPASSHEAVDRLVGPVFAFAVLALTWWTGLRMIRKGSRRRTRWLVPMLCACSLASMPGIRSAAPSPHRDVKGHWIIYDRFASGYFSEAAFYVDSARELLSGYEARMAKGDVLHEGTHPPGLYLLNYCALQLTSEAPGLATLMATMRGTEVEGLFRSLEASAGQGPRLTDSQLNALTLVVVLTQLVLALAPWMVYGLLVLISNRTAAWHAACITVTVPALQVFFPKSDVLFATTGSLLLWVGMASFLLPSRMRRLSCSVLTAIVLFGCLLLSLAHLPAVMVLLVATCLLALQGHGERFRTVAASAAVSLLTFGMLCTGWQLLTDCNLFSVWRMNLRNHAGFYDQFPRTVWRWWLINPFELAMATGVGVFLLAGTSCWRAMAAIWTEARSGRREWSAASCLTAAIGLTVVALWASGRNSGEAARLWCFLTPWLAVCAVTPPYQAGATQLAATESLVHRNWSVLLVCQFIGAVLVIARVNGFLQL
jgi:hypothetical protein